jgi:chromosome segregation ATPase
VKLSRIRIEQFKQFRQPVEIKELEAGVNLFTGPNEAGKSTIVAAIRAAFFERHRSASVDDLRPWGDSTASPTVELEFVVAGKAYRLTKSFLGKKRCELQLGGQRIDGAAAEDHLAELLGFQYAGRGASGAEHWGIPGLLWIQQGAAQDIKDSVAHATGHLRTALNESLGEVASSGGDEVLSAIEDARNGLLTPSSGAPRGPYADAIKKEAVLIGAIKEIDGEIDAYRQKVDTLASLRREHVADEAEKPWAAFREQEQEAAGKLNAIQRVEVSLAHDRQRANQLEAQVKLLRSQLDTFTGHEQEVSARVAALESTTQVLSNATNLVEQWKSKSTEANKRYESTRETLRVARQESARRSLNGQLDDLKLKAESTGAALAKAEAERATLLELQTQAAATEISAEDLASLREQHRQIRELQIRRASAATRLGFVLAEGRSFQVGAESLSGTGERLLLETTIVMLPGLGRLEISPGGADLAELGREEKALTDSHAALRQRLGLASLDAAEDRHRTYAQRLAEAKTSTATLKVLAPKGTEALRTEQAGHETRAKEVEQTLGQLPPAAEPPAALISVSEAEVAEEAARRSLEQINTSLNQAKVAAGNARTEFEAATRELAAAKALLDAPGRSERVSAANQDLVDARAEQATAANRIEVLAKQVTDARPDILKQDVERFQKSAAQHEKRHGDRRDMLMRLEVELETAGAQGLDERHAELARDLAQMQRRVEELRRHARALDHLLDLLRAKRIALTRRLQAPLQKHLNRYLLLLFPQASLEIDEGLSPGPLTRTGARGIESGAFEALSFGAREQMGVISRLAYADLLQEAGRPTLIILDDALVHSDDERLAQMKRVLFDAATRHQILLFTCHPANWRDLGVVSRSLTSLAA